LSILPEDILSMPIRKIYFSNSEELDMHNGLVNLVDKMLILNQDLNKIGYNRTDERARLEEEIKKTNSEINE
jgi:hypothetical protein